MTTADFALDLRACLTPPQHIGIGSGTCIVQPLLPTVCGVSNCFSPPFAANGLRLSLNFLAGEHPIRDDGNTRKGDCGVLYAGGTWLPDRIERHGTYHHIINGKLISLAVSSTLVPLFKQAGFVLLVSVRNRGDADQTINIEPALDPAAPDLWPLDKWDFRIPSPATPATPDGPSRWTNGTIDIHLVHRITAQVLRPGQEGQWKLAVIMQEAGSALSAPADLTSLAQTTRDAWNRRISDIATRLPLLESNDPLLDAYYRRSLASGLVCLWERDDFVCNPFVATCGMDGGGICAYPWDVCGYPPKAVASLLGPPARDLLRVMGTFGLDKHMLFSPTGSGMHHYYSYSAWSYISFVWAMACQYGPDPAVFQQACDLFLGIERSLQLQDNLADYGIQKNLLEMRGSGWEHYVASPNAERAWCFDRLADLGDQLGQGTSAEWRAQAADIRKQIRAKLWDAKAGWFRCLYPNGHTDLVYSIQGFDALRAGACTEEMANAMLSHIRDGAFLGKYGVSSVSAEDERHYELNDPDWSGGGAYSGDGPQLSLILWELGKPELAWDVLRRHLWMGQHLTYYPQEHYCDRPAVAGHKRSNIISGIAGVETILFGLIGLSPRIDGTLWIRPQPPEHLTLSIKGFAFRGHSIDVHLTKGRGEAVVDGVSQGLKLGESVQII